MIAKSTIPEGQCGIWRVERFRVSEEQAKFEMLRSLNPSSRGRFVPAGEYTRLWRGRTVVMSDTPDELRDHSFMAYEATDRVLINGLGLGVCLAAVLAKQDVTAVRVIEIAPEVIELVGSHFDDPRLEIINADALIYKPAKGERFAVVWHDIWDDLCADNLAEMKMLHRRYGRRCNWQGSWCRGLIERLAA